MGKSLQDQLLNIGVASEKQAKKIKADKRKQKKQQQHKKQQSTVNENQVAARKAALEKAEKDKRLNQQKQKLAEQQATEAQIKQLIEANKKLQGDEEIQYHFVMDNKVKTAYVDEAIKAQLVKGKLAIVVCEHGFQVIDLDAAEKIKIRKPEIVFIPDPNASEVSEDDEYKDFQIPDDLMW